MAPQIESMRDAIAEIKDLFFRYCCRDIIAGVGSRVSWRKNHSPSGEAARRKNFAASSASSSMKNERKRI